MKQANRQFLSTIMANNREKLEDYAVRWVHANSQDLSVTDKPTPQTRNLVHRVFESYLAILLENNEDVLHEFIAFVVDLRGGMLFNVSTPQRGFYSFRQAIVKALDDYDLTAEARLEFIIQIDEIYVSTMHTLSDKFMHKVNEKMESLYLEARHANEAKSQFLASMSHEIRTPMNAVLGYVQILQRDTDLAEKQQRHLKTIHRSGLHLLSLINDVLDMAKIESGKHDIIETEHNLDRLLLDVERMFRLPADEKGVQLTFIRDPSVPTTVLTDGSKVRQVLINLLSNAVKFTDEGKITVRSSSHVVEQEQSCVVIEVEDTGVGLHESDLEHVFGKFNQTHTGVQREGTGLGLAVSRSFAHLLHGTLTASSTFGKGSIFRFEFLTRICDSESTPKQESPIMGLHPDDIPPLILAVDDHTENLAMLEILLKAVGFNVRCASDGASALANVMVLRPDLILLDLLMPGMSGIDVIKALREIPAYRDLPVVILSASALGNDRERALEVGANDFIHKPFEENDLFDCIARHTGIRYTREKTVTIPITDRNVPTKAQVNLSDEQVEILREATLTSDIIAIQAVVDSLQSSQPALAKRIAKLVDQFNYDAIAHLIE